MGRTVGLRTDFSAVDLWRLAAASTDANQSRRLLSLAVVRDGMNRTESAKIGGIDRQTLRDWVHRCESARSAKSPSTQTKSRMAVKSVEVTTSARIRTAAMAPPSDNGTTNAASAATEMQPVLTPHQMDWLSTSVPVAPKLAGVSQAAVQGLNPVVGHTAKILAQHLPTAKTRDALIEDLLEPILGERGLA
jgi:hypothetical protein